MYAGGPSCNCCASFVLISAADLFVDTPHCKQHFASVVKSFDLFEGVYLCRFVAQTGTEVGAWQAVVAPSPSSANRCNTCSSYARVPLLSRVQHFVFCAGWLVVG